MRTMKVIHHNVVVQKKDAPMTRTQKTRVAAYCRVSTLEEEQESDVQFTVTQETRRS